MVMGRVNTLQLGSGFDSNINVIHFQHLRKYYALKLKILITMPCKIFCHVISVKKNHSFPPLSI